MAVSGQHETISIICPEHETISIYCTSFPFPTTSKVTGIVKNTRPDRQTALFSATFPPKVEMLGREYLNRPVRVMVGRTGDTADTVEQRFLVLEKEEDRLEWLKRELVGIAAMGQVGNLEMILWRVVV